MLQAASRPMDNGLSPCSCATRRTPESPSMTTSTFTIASARSRPSAHSLRFGGVLFPGVHVFQVAAELSVVAQRAVDHLLRAFRYRFDDAGHHVDRSLHLFLRVTVR